MGESSQHIHVGIAFDQNYLAPFYALVQSLISSHPSGKLKIHAITSGVSEDEKSSILSYLKSHNADIAYYTLDTGVISKFVLPANWTPAAYYKMFFPLLVPDSVRRLLYLDTDTIVLKDLTSLYNIDLDGRPLAAVYDNYVKTQPLLNINEEGEYFNSGVMLIDVPLWRNQQITEKAINYTLSFPERIRFVDQCALNGVLHHHWKRIDQKYNLLYSYIPQHISLKELKNFLSDKAIIHFTLQRPWKMLCTNRLRYLYYENLMQTPVARKQKRYTDFAFRKIPAWIRLRVMEFYFDNPGLQYFWRKTKRLR